MGPDNSTRQSSDTGGLPTAPAPRITIPAPNIDGLLVVIVRHWRWILATTLAFGIGVLLALPFLTTSYQISASLLVKLGREQVAPPVAGATVPLSPLKRSEDVTSEIEILNNQALIERLVNELGVAYFTRRPEPQTLFQQAKAIAREAFDAVRNAWTEVLIFAGLEKRLTPFERVVATLQASIKTEVVRRSDVIEVTLLATDPQAGKHVLKRLLDLYQQEHIRVFRTPGATEFLQGRVNELSAQLASIGERRRALAFTGSVHDFAQQQRMLLEQLHDARTVQARTAEEMAQLARETEQFEAALATPFEEWRQQRIEQVNPSLQALEARLTERRAALATLRLTYTDDSERVQDERAAIRELEALIATTPPRNVQSETFQRSLTRQDVERGLIDRRNRRAGKEAMLAQAAQSVAQAEAALRAFESQGELARELARQAEVTEQSYRLFVQRLDEARILERLDEARISNVALIGEPVASVRPVRPRAMLMFLVALGAGLFGSIGFFLLRDALRPVIHSRDRAAEVLGVPVLVRLPEVKP